MTQGEIEKLGQKTAKIFSELEIRIMSDIVRRIKINGFSTAGADWQFSRLQQLGKSEKDIKKWIQEALETSEEEIDKIFSEETYKEYMGFERAYEIYGLEQIPYEENIQLQHLMEAAKKQISMEFNNMANSMGFAIKDPMGNITYTPLLNFYRSTMDNAVMDIQSGAFSYQRVLERTIRKMTVSGVRWIDYDSGWHNRIDVAARRAVLTGFRQTQSHINEMVAKDLGTDYYEVTYHVGARPTHQPWQGRVWSRRELETVCGLGTGPGLLGWNCYHDYYPFIPGVSVRTYTDDQLEQMIAEENSLKDYNGRQYTTYEALQQQRKMETAMRKTRQDIKLLQEGEADETSVTLKKAKYYGQMKNYEDFSKKMNLPLQKQRIYQDGLKGTFSDKRAYDRIQAVKEAKNARAKGLAANVRIRKSNIAIYSNKKVFFNEKSDYTVRIQEYSEKVNKTLTDVAIDVAKKGSKDGFEHMHLVDLIEGRDVFYETNEDPLSVGYEFWEIIRENPERKYAFVHNHNLESSLSIQDIMTAATTKNIPLMVAVQNDGIIYYANKVKDAPEGFYPDSYFKEDIKLLNEQLKSGTITIAERSAKREELMIQKTLEEFFDGMVIVDGKEE